MVVQNTVPSGAISLTGVSKTFHTSDGERFQALKDIDLVIKSGEIVSLIGPSGCGKTTILRLVAGLETPSLGIVEIDGQAVRGPDKGKAFMSQDSNLFPWLTVVKNIAFGLEVGKKRENLNPREIRKRVANLVRMVGLEDFEDAYPHELSGGMAQRVALARALANEPRFMFLDEPFASLDAFTRMALQEQLIGIWQKRGNTILLVTHDIDEAVTMSHRVVIMSPTPGTIAEIVEIPLGRPRDRTDYDFLRLRTQIYNEFHTGAPKPFAYQI